jgi:DNA-nicking Smr family endonuclease
MSKRDRKRQSAVDDWHLWHEVARSISPLRPNRKLTPELIEPGDHPKVQTPHRAKPAKGTPVRRPATAHKLPPPQADRLIEPRLRQKLVRGRLPIEATIDLHGMRQAEARAALSRFVHACVARGDRSVLVITGKGSRGSDDPARQHGILRTMLPIWLTEGELSPLISGYEISARAHGGEGAFYVRLKRGSA